MAWDKVCARWGLSALALSGCLPDNPGTSSGTEGETTVDGTTTGGTEPVPEGGMLGCPIGETCTLVLVSQTLDDRVEIFSPDDPEGNVYRGSIGLDLKPGITDEGLDEPFGLTIAGGYVHVLLGHYPQRDRGSLVSFPFEFFADRDAGERVPVSEFFAGGSFMGGPVYVDLGEVEPIFMLHEAVDGRLLVGTFANDLFDVETNWITPGKLLVVDAGDPTQFGARTLTGLEGGDCIGGSDLVRVGPNAIAMACDGNEAVALLDLGMIGSETPQDAADGISGKVCDLIPTGNRRVRYLAFDGVSTLVVPEGPTPLDITSNAVLNKIDVEDCSTGAPTIVGQGGASQLGELIALPGEIPTFLFASGQGPLTEGNRGIFVARDAGDAGLEVCGPIVGFGEGGHWSTQGFDIDPLALALAPDGNHLAVGAGAFANSTIDGASGKVLWATLSGMDDPCTATAVVVDLSAEAPFLPADPSTHRRAPSVVVLHEVRGPAGV
jgi:hypothetical protein